MTEVFGIAACCLGVVRGEDVEVAAVAIVVDVACRGFVRMAALSVFLSFATADGGEDVGLTAIAAIVAVCAAYVRRLCKEGSWRICTFPFMCTKNHFISCDSAGAGGVAIAVEVC